MKFRAIFGFELSYQLRSFSTWIYFAIAFLFPLCFSSIGESTDAEVYRNAPAFLILLTVMVSVIVLLAAGSIAGHAAARDVQTGMHPLVFTSPMKKWEYLGGRFLAAFVLYALIYLAVPIGFYLSFAFREADPLRIGPFHAEPYLTTYLFLSLPLAFVSAACQFTFALLNRRAISAYVPSVLLFPVISVFIGTTVANLTSNWELMKLIDLVGVSILGSMDGWTTFEKNNRGVQLEAIFVWNRILWLGVACVCLSFAFVKFKFAHAVSGSWWLRRKRIPADLPDAGARLPVAVVKPATLNKEEELREVHRPYFGFLSKIRQTQAIAWSSFIMIVRSTTGLTVVGYIALQFVFFAPEYLMSRGVPQMATTMNVLALLTASLPNFKTPLVIMPMLIVFYAGELVWRERDVRINTISDAAPVSEWMLILGKFLGLTFIIEVWLGFLLIAGIFIQVISGYQEIGFIPFLQAFYGFQLADYLLFAVLALAVHVIVDHKYLAHGVLLFIFLFLIFHDKLGIEHHLSLYASDPGWFYTDMRGFDPYVVPWMWFKLYWIGWAMLLVVMARLAWVRSQSTDFLARIHLAFERFTQPTLYMFLIACAIILFSGSFIFYNTNVLNDYSTSSDERKQAAKYEKNYSLYQDVPQPQLTGVKLSVSLYPSQRKATIQGSYTLLNKTQSQINSIHITTAPGVATRIVDLGQSASRTLEDTVLGYQIFELDEPLLSGDSLTLSFTADLHAKGFTNNGIDASIIENGSYFISYDKLPLVGYQPNRTLRNDGQRKALGLAPREIPSLYDPAANKVESGQELITFESIVSTEADQVAIGPGALIRKWSEGNRNYRHYATRARIRNTYSFFSARYEERHTPWHDPVDSSRHVSIDVYYHPKHSENITHIIESAKASLHYYTTEFGRYPYDHLTIIERSGYAGELNAEPTTIDYGETFPLSNVTNDKWHLNLIYFAIAHEVAHQWWGAAQLLPAHVEGSILLSETLANYSGLKVLEEKYGREQVRKLLTLWQNSYDVPRVRDTPPLLQATDAFLGYRKGPLALYALMQYTDKDAINKALHQLSKKHSSGEPPFATSLDLYRELKVVTPDTLQQLLQDLFEKNIYWQLKTEQATSKQIDSITWEVTVKLSAQKVTVDSTGAEISVPMNDWVEIGVYAPWQEGQRGRVLYLQKHRIKSGKQTLTIIVHEKPDHAGIDPNYFLIDLDQENNTKSVKVEGEDGGLDLI